MLKINNVLCTIGRAVLLIQLNKKKIVLDKNRLTNKTNQLKIIYGELLRKSEVANNYSHLLRVVTQISELSL